MLNYSLSRLRRWVLSLLMDPTQFWVLASLVVAGDAVLTQLIVRFVSYTEIDWETYMAQVELYIKGQRNYSMIAGPTGPLVYPAGHVYIHRFLHDITDSGTNITAVQHIYVALYIISVALTCAIYNQAKGVPNWLVLLLPFSKRLHSIYVLRLFNDCWSVVAVQAAILSIQCDWNDIGILLFSSALSIKMSVLLYLPGLLVIFFKRSGLIRTMRYLFILVLSQILLSLPFLRDDPWSYLQASFDLNRVFLYKWTVNWRFVTEETFLAPAWSKGLLIGHASALVAFGLFKWCKCDGSVYTVLQRGFRRPMLPASLFPVTADYVATVLFTSNLIGIVFARSLHYQFYSWYAQQLPFLTRRTRYPLVLKIAIMMCIEYSWNIFPSTPFSSGILLAANAVLLVGIWFGYPDGRA